MTDVVTDIICDICGKSCLKSNKKLPDAIHSAEYSEMKANWGYYSNKDGDVWNFNFCEICSDMLKDFIVNLQLGRNIEK